MAFVRAALAERHLFGQKRGLLSGSYYVHKQAALEVATAC